MKSLKINTFLCAIIYEFNINRKNGIESLVLHLKDAETDKFKNSEFFTVFESYKH